MTIQDVTSKDSVTLTELQPFLAVVDLEDGEMASGVTTYCNGTFPLDGLPRVDRNGDEYRWHNFFVTSGEVYDELADEFGEETPIDWTVLYDYGVTSSQLERNLDKQLPLGAKAKVTIQRSGQNINVLTHELMVKSGAVADRFSAQKTGRTINSGATINEQEQAMQDA